jgi:hypothetical protein
MISIAHNGQELGQFSAEDVASLLASGQIDKTAYYWVEGMPEWRLITEIIELGTEASDVTDAAAASASGKRKVRRDPTAPSKTHINFLTRRDIPVDGLTKTSAAALVEETKRQEKLEGGAATARQLAFLDYHQIRYGLGLTKDEATSLIYEADLPKAQWMKERHLLYPHLFPPPTVSPMTDKQKAFLDYHGIVYTDDTTREDASALVERVTRDPAYGDSKWNAFKHLIRPDIYEKPQILSSSMKELEEAKERLIAAQEEHQRLAKDTNADPDEVDFAKGDIKDIQEEIQYLKEAIKDDKIAEQEEAEYASTSFLEAWAEGYYEPTGEELQRFMSVVKKPTKAQYKVLREKLAADVGLCISALSLDQFLSLYVQQFPEALKEPYKKEDFAALSLEIPKTYQQQIQMR